MKWTATKIVTRENGSTIIGCVVGPFDSEIDAVNYTTRAAVGSLGYEKWLVRELQPPAAL